MTPRIAIFLDYQNIYFSALSVFQPTGVPHRRCYVDPVRVAHRIVAKRRLGGELTAVRVYRGRPSPDRQPEAARASDRQSSQWERDPRVTVVRRQLRYPKGWPVEPGQEKGVDVVGWPWISSGWPARVPTTSAFCSAETPT